MLPPHEVYRTLRAASTARREGEAPLSAEHAEREMARALALVRGVFEGWPIDGGELAAALADLPQRLDDVPEARLEEVALATGCAAGEPGALRALESQYMITAEGALRAMNLDEAQVQDVLQEVRRKLLTQTEAGGPPKLLAYAGRGSLRGLLKVSATRTAISMLRKGSRETPGTEAVLDRTGERDPELQFLKRHYRGAFREAFEAAVMGLTPRQRNLLRLHFIRKMTLESLATMYGVHRATIVRHLAAAREAIDKATRKGLGARLEVTPSELDEVMGLIRSRLDVSVDRLLATIDE